MPPTLRSRLKGQPPKKEAPETEPLPKGNSLRKVVSKTEPPQTRVITMRRSDAPAPEVEINPVTQPIIQASREEEKEANADFKSFFAKHYLDNHGFPTPSIFKQPIAFELFNQDGLFNMRSVVNDIRGLVLLRKDLSHLVIGWNTAMLSLTIREFKKRKIHHTTQYTTQTAQLAIEPKFFFGTNLGINLDEDHPTPKQQRRNDLVMVDISVLREGSVASLSVEHALRKEPDLVIDSQGDIAILGWNRESVSAEKERLQATEHGRKAEMNHELQKMKRYWTERAKTIKAEQSVTYFLALHNSIRAQVNQLPGPPKEFEASYLPGFYMVKVRWADLKEAFQFPGWDSDRPSDKFKCRGREAGPHEMKLHIQPDTELGQDGTFSAKFHFGLIEGTMTLSTSPENLFSDVGHSLDGSLDSSMTTAVEGETTLDNATRDKTEEKDEETRVSKRKLDSVEEESDSSVVSNGQPAQKRVRFTTRSTSPKQGEDIAHENHAQAGDFTHKNQLQPSTSEAPRPSRKDQRHPCVLHIHVPNPRRRRWQHNSGSRCGTTKRRRREPWSLPLHDNDPQVYLGAKGYFKCPAIGDGENKISIYRISSGKRLSTD
ncbi:hypothetical protein QBC37DRAFT_398952 [Rhypophila decipiens]|uniref:Uncharacterized protein n=1 Tax=Rhypophila decipiens TaxID=261697 RepID=A0AAN7B8X3_9PEZI|nr:hypothetical protein QBC37DRAFT_398952 [Rhypophila decipiens]